MHNAVNKGNGFTLVEMAVVVFLIGILATMGLSAANSLLASSSISTTKKKQEVIRDALIAYIATNKRLPCPAKDENGNEYHNAATPRICSGYFGVIPYQELGLQKSSAIDGWGNMFSYAVSSQWTLTYSNTDSATTSSDPVISFNTGDIGTLPIKNRPDPADAATADIGTAAVIVISHGMNGLGAFTSKGTRNSLPVTETADERKNIVPEDFKVTGAFYQREYTDVDVPIYGSFDDVLLTLSSKEIISQLIKYGAVKPIEAEWLEQIDRINEVLISYMLDPSNENCAPPDNSAFLALMTNNNILLSDPWGSKITYAKQINKLEKDGKVTPNSETPYLLGTESNRFMYEPYISTFIKKYENIISTNCQ